MQVLPSSLTMPIMTQPFHFARDANCPISCGSVSRTNASVPHATILPLSGAVDGLSASSCCSICKTF